MSTRWIWITPVVLSSAFAQPPAGYSSPVFARYGIHAVTGGTSERDAEFTARLGPDVMQSITDIRSNVAMIRNDGPHTIVSFIWIWTVVTPDGRAFLLDQPLGR